jgi:hypothetical protein
MDHAKAPCSLNQWLDKVGMMPEDSMIIQPFNWTYFISQVDETRIKKDHLMSLFDSINNRLGRS